MIRAMNDFSTQQFLSALESIDRRAERAEQQITSGRKISFASDAPDEIGRVLAARAELERTVQVGANLVRVKAEIDAGEQALEQALKILERVTTVGLQAANETQTPEQRRAIGIEVAAALEQLVAVAGSAVEGRYLFSGDSDQTAPYTLDGMQPNGVSPYAGSASTRETLGPAGNRIAIGKTAQEIFDDPAAGVFAAVNSLASTLRNDAEMPYPAQTAAIDGAMSALKAAHEHVSAKLSDYGTLQNRVADGIDDAHKQETRMQTSLSDMEDADITAAILELNQTQVHRQAAVAARARVSGTNLFDYLK